MRAGAEQGLDPLVFTVTRTGVTTGTTNVTLAWSGSAKLTTDYTVGVSGATISANRLTLTFAAGNGGDGDLDAGRRHGDRAYRAGRPDVGAGTGYTVGTPAWATGTIADNDTPVVRVVASDAAGAEQGQDTIVFSVTRTGNTTVSTAVSLAWSGAATLTTDYTVGVTGATISADR